MLSNRSPMATRSILFCLGALGCQAPGAMPLSGSAQPVASMALSSKSLFDGLKALPASGPGSLAATYSTIGAMSFAQFYRVLYADSADANVVIDGHALGNPKQQLAAHRDEFLAFGTNYATVGDWWQAAGTKPDLLTTEQQYKADLDAALNPSGLGLVGCNGGSVFPRGTLPSVPLFIPNSNLSPEDTGSVQPVSEWGGSLPASSQTPAAQAQPTPTPTQTPSPSQNVPQSQPIPIPRGVNRMVGGTLVEHRYRDQQRVYRPRDVEIENAVNAGTLPKPGDEADYTDEKYPDPNKTGTCPNNP